MVLIVSEKFDLSRVFFTQSAPSDNWLFNHTLNRVPSVQVTDLAGNILFVETVARLTSVEVRSTEPITGVVYLF